jgi:hypothetical protein
MENKNMNYLDDKIGHMNAANLLSLKYELESLDLKDIYKEVELHKYPIDNYKKLNKEALISEIIIWNADNDIPVEAEELEAVLNNNITYINEDVN